MELEELYGRALKKFLARRGVKAVALVARDEFGEGVGVCVFTQWGRHKFHFDHFALPEVAVDEMMQELGG